MVLSLALMSNLKAGETISQVCSTRPTWITNTKAHAKNNNSSRVPNRILPFRTLQCCTFVSRCTNLNLDMGCVVPNHPLPFGAY